MAIHVSRISHTNMDRVYILEHLSRKHDSLADLHNTDEWRGHRQEGLLRPTQGDSAAASITCTPDPMPVSSKSAWESKADTVTATATPAPQKLVGSPARMSQSAVRHCTTPDCKRFKQETKPSYDDTITTTTTKERSTVHSNVFIRATHHIPSTQSSKEDRRHANP